MKAKVKSNPIVIYLASQSPRRSYLLRQAGYRCRVIVSSYVEKHEHYAVPRNLVVKHARGKLKEAHIPRLARFVVAADTVVALRGKVYGKPKNLTHAVRMLSKLSGNIHDVYTGWAIKDTATGEQSVRCVKSRVKIKSMSTPQIRAYFKKMNPLDKAGSYAVQSRPSVVEYIQGSYSNVMGLPVEDFQKILKQMLRRKPYVSKK